MNKLSLTTLLISTFLMGETITMEGQESDRDDALFRSAAGLNLGENVSDNDDSGVELAPEHELIPPTYATLENRFNIPLFGETIEKSDVFFESHLRDPARPHLNSLITDYNELHQERLRAFYEKMKVQNGDFDDEDEQTLNDIAAALTKIVDQKRERGELSGNIAAKCESQIDELRIEYLRKIRTMILQEHEQQVN